MVNHDSSKNIPILVIVGPSGSGKTSLNTRLIVDHPDIFENSISCTSRAIRDGERDGVNYYFVSSEEFDRMVINNDFVEYTNYVGNKYGTLKSEMIRITALAKVPVLEIEMDGLRQVFKAGFFMKSLFVQPENLETLRKRLQDRGRESAEVINRRLERAGQEIEESKQFPFDFVLINEDFDRAYMNMIHKLKEWYPALQHKLSSN